MTTIKKASETEELEKLIELYKTTKADSEVVLSKLPMSVRSGWGSRITQAQANLPKITQTYREKVLPMCAPIFVTGNGIEELVEGAEKEANVTIIEPLELVKTISDFIENNLGADRAFTPHLHRQVFSMICNSCADLGISDIFAPEYKSYNMQTRNQIETFVKDMVFTISDGTIFTETLKQKATNGAMESKFTGPIVLVFIKGLTDEDIQRVNTNVFKIDKTIVNLTDKVTDATVLSVLKQVKNNIKAAKGAKQ